MSQIIAHCPTCQKQYKIDSSLVGRVLKCKSCETLFQIDSPASTPPHPPVAAHGHGPTQPVPVVPSFQASSDPFAMDPMNIDPYAVDPLATPVPAAPHAAPVHQTTAATRTWKPTAKKSAIQPVGAPERAMLMLGAFLLIFGIIMNLLPLFGMQVARFQGSGKFGQIVGMLMGLAGAGLVGAGLRRLLLPAIISGAVSAVLVLILFVVSISVGKDTAPVSTAGGDELIDEEFALEVTNVKGPWLVKYPEWTGFSLEMSGAQTYDRQWERYATSIPGVSISFPAEATRGTGNVTIAGESVRSTQVVTRYDNNHFYFDAFSYPTEGVDAAEMLDAAEKTVNGISRSQPVEIDGQPGREYTAQSSNRGQRGLIVVIGTNIAHARVDAEGSAIEENISRKFLSSLHIDSSDTGTDDAAGALDPFTFEQPGDAPDVPELPPGVSDDPVINLTSDQQQRDKDISLYMRSIESAMEQHIHRRCTQNFSSRYLTITGGDDAGAKRYLAHPSKVPITGVDLLVVKSGGTHVLKSIAPVYEGVDQKASVTAKSGYGLSGVQVNAHRFVEGIRFVFSKVTDSGFDMSDSYESEWFGTAPSGSGTLIKSDGRPVYGLWMHKGQFCRSIGLIREKS